MGLCRKLKSTLQKLKIEVFLGVRLALHLAKQIKIVMNAYNTRRATNGKTRIATIGSFAVVKEDIVKGGKNLLVEESLVVKEKYTAIASEFLSGPETFEKNKETE